MNREERNIYNRAWYAKNKERIRKYQRDWKRARPEQKEKSRIRMAALRAANPEHYRNYLRKRAGLPEATRPCPDLCECCNTYKATHLDHCHVSGTFRGWLCGRCNRSIGQLGDNIEGLMNAVRYLERAAK
jgi:recombination endonuclease VII